MKRYMGYWNAGVRKVVVIEDDVASDLKAYTRHVVQNWNEPLAWRGRDNAVLNLAYSILVDCLGKERASEKYVWFAREVLARTPQQSFEIREQEILLWLEERVAA